MTLPKRIINVAVLLAAFCVQGAVCQADDAQAAIHRLMGPPPAYTEGPEWEASKKALAIYSPEQLVRALIVEIDRDRGSANKNFLRDVNAYKLFRALDLPPAVVCQELDKPQSADRKASLMCLLRSARKPEVVQVLLRQLGDLRYVTMQEGAIIEHSKPRPLRVRDVAFNALVDNVNNPGLRRPTLVYGDGIRDEMIQEGLTKLNLTPP